MLRRMHIDVPVSVRNQTSGDVFRLILARRAATKAEIAQATGLASSTVTHALNRLIGDGYIAKEVGLARRDAARGRPSDVFRPIPTGRHTAAIDFGHGHIRVALGNDLGDALGETVVPMNVDIEANEAMDVGADCVRDLKSKYRVADLSCVVAGIPGPLDQETGVVCSATILSSWVGLVPALELGNRLGAPVHVENDAALGAYGELVDGAGRGHQDFVYVKASHGIGAGLVLKGDLFKGAGGLAGEIGHTRLPNRNELCRCGNRGCLEAVISVDSITSQIIHTHPHLAAGVATIGDNNDPVTSRLLESAGRTLGAVLAPFCNLLNPSALILGGELGAHSIPLLEGVRLAINNDAQPAIAAGVSVLAAELGSRAELVGGLRLASLMVRTNLDLAI